MIDGFKSEHGYLLPNVWLDNEALFFPLTIDERTGERIAVTRKAEYQGLTFEIVPSSRNPDITRQFLRGSLHKYFNGGRGNHNDFSLDDVRQTVKSLAGHFGIEPNRAVLRGLEFGVNIRLPFPVKQILDSIICYNNKPFQGMNLRHLKIGKQIVRDEYSLKIYDKGKQSGLETENLLRVEMAVRKMRYLSRLNIVTLADIAIPEKMAGLGQHLVKTFNEIIMEEPSINQANLTDQERVKLTYFLNPRFWEQLPLHKRYKQRRKFEALKTRRGTFNLQENVSNIIFQKWEQLLGNKAEKGGYFHPDSEGGKHFGGVMFSQCKCKVKTSPRGDFAGISQEGEISENIRGANFRQLRAGRIENRKCVSCGRSISHQRKDSIFCSEKYRGKAAKKCRNQDSNLRSFLIRKIMQGKQANDWLQISYVSEGEIFTDTLHASEIKAPKNWVNLVTAVTRLKDQPPTVLTGKDARNLLHKLSRENGRIVSTRIRSGEKQGETS